MTTAPSRITIETAQQSTLFFGSTNAVLASISKVLQAKDMGINHAILHSGDVKLTAKPITPAMLLHELQSLVPDYVIINVDQNFRDWFSSDENKDLLKKASLLWKNAKTMKLVWPGSEINFETDRTCYLSEVVGLDNSTVTKFTAQASRGNIEIPGDGLTNINPLVPQDAADACIEYLLSPYITTSQAVVENPESISLLNLAHKIRTGLKHKVNVSFVDQQDDLNPSFNAPSIHDLIGWKPTFSLDETISLALKNIHKHDSPPIAKNTSAVGEFTAPTTPPNNRFHLKPLNKHLKKSKKLEFTPVKPQKKPKIQRFSNAFKHARSRIFTRRDQGKKRKSRWLLPFILLFIYFFSIVLSGFLMIFSSSLLISRIKQGSATSTPAHILSMTSSYVQANLTMIRTIPILNSSKKIQEFYTLTGALITIAQAGEVASETSILAEAIFDHILSDESPEINNNLQSLSRNISVLYEILSLTQGQLPDETPSIIPERWTDKYQSLKEQLTYARKALLAAKNITTTLNEVLGIGESRKYAILLQNNMELRPTGGFIGSFAIVDLENGQLFDLQVYDVYQADGQLKGHVEPPAPIKTHLGEINWYLRDSNWDPNFPTSARRAEWFIDKTIGQQIDGTIGINVYTVRNILQALGPINLPDYDEEITAQNLFERAEYHSEINFFPGSTQKKEFLASLTNALFLKLQKPDKNQAILLARSLYDSVNQNQLTFSTKNIQSEAVFEQLGWTGSIKDLPCPKLETSQECFNDYVYIVDANLGINKANFFIRRSIEADVTIAKDFTVKNKLTITYTNTSASNAWPAGLYKNYQRIYLPGSSNIKSIIVGGVKLNSTQITLEAQKGKTVVGYIVEVPLSSTIKVELEYSLPGKINQNSPLYSLYWQKQSGTDDDPLTIRVHYPLFLQPKIISPTARVDTQLITFDLFSTQDRRIVVDF